MELKNVKYSSFTLIELLISISILAILSAALIPNLISFSSDRNADRVANAFVADIQLARNKALSGAYTTGTSPTRESEYWGIRITSCTGSEYKLGYFDGVNFYEIETKRLPSGYAFSACDPSGASMNLRFTRLTGFIPDADDQDPRITMIRASMSRTVNINSTGMITITNP